jgi:hypothetical protein
VNLLHVLIDDRERKPLPMPANLVVVRGNGSLTTVPVKYEKKRLDTADYMLAGREDIGVERKNSIRELAENCRPDSRDRPRFIRCLQRLSLYRRSLLLVEGNPMSLVGPGVPDKLRVGLDELFMLLAEHSPSTAFMTVQTGSLPQRRSAGEFMLRWLHGNSLATAHHGDFLDGPTQD